MSEAERIPAWELPARDLVTHAYHLHVVEALVAERNEARAEVERLREALLDIARSNMIAHDSPEASQMAREAVPDWEIPEDEMKRRLAALDD